VQALQLRDAGVSTAAIARQLGIARSTVRGWLDPRAGVAQPGEAIRLKRIQWGFESLHQHQFPAYAYLLGMYLGDGYIAHLGQQYILRVYLNRKQRLVIERVREAIEALLPGLRVNYVQSRQAAVTVVTCYGRMWPEVFPQHGPGRKHTRKIELTAWQDQIVRTCPAEFLRGLLESDGSRHRRIVRGCDYPAYSFTNHSEDILQLFMWACGLVGVRCRRSSRRNLSIARRPDVRYLDALFGVPAAPPTASAYTESAIPSSARNTSTPGA
jgi:hypothetical protein